MNSWWWWSGAQVSCLCVCLCRKKMRKIILKSFKIEFISNWLKFSFFFVQYKNQNAVHHHSTFFFVCEHQKQNKKKSQKFSFFPISNYKWKKIFLMMVPGRFFFLLLLLFQCISLSFDFLRSNRIELNWIENNIFLINVNFAIRFFKFFTKKKS